MGVPLFFVLSGFLISRPFLKGRRKDLRFWYIYGYARRRIGKILPPFYLSIVVFTAFYWIWLHDASYFGAARGNGQRGYPEIYKMSTRSAVQRLLRGASSSRRTSTWCSRCFSFAHADFRSGKARSPSWQSCSSCSPSPLRQIALGGDGRLLGHVGGEMNTPLFCGSFSVLPARLFCIRRGLCRRSTSAFRESRDRDTRKLSICRAMRP